jgi:hydroxymethylpyrimidine pyrophosphatase-like HAD family hydrolase
VARGLSLGSRRATARHHREEAISALTAPDLLPRPRLLACAIDVTLVDRERRLRPVVRDALRRVAATGVRVVLVTGRAPWDGIAALAEDLDLEGPQITMQGALVSDPRSGAVAG